MPVVVPSARWFAVLTAIVPALLLFFFIGGGWISDDFVHFTWLPTVSSASDLVTRPDQFGFYRPLAQLSFWVQGNLFGYHPSQFRAVNGLLHVAVIGLVYLVGSHLVTRRAAFLATLAFALTPKAPAVATLWASARPELLMSIFALLSAWAWLRWQEQRGSWLAVAAAFYLAAFLSKESAVLLPIALAALPASRAATSTRERIVGAAAIAAMAVLPLVMRADARALMPSSAHEHYDLDFSAYRVLRSLQIYVPRALPSPAALLAAVAGAVVMSTRRIPLLRARRDRGAIAIAAAAWFVLLLAPVMPIAARNELYLYLPVIGLCFLAGAIADDMIDAAHTPTLRAAIAIYIVGFIAYQQTRHSRAHEVQLFTAALVGSIASDQRLRSFHGDLEFVAADDHSRELMQTGVGGYLNGVTVMAIPARTFGALAVYDGRGSRSERVTYRFSDRDLKLELSGGGPTPHNP